MTPPGPAPALSALGRAAVALAERGWLVFPCKPRTKVPWTGEGGFRRATRDVSQITRSWITHPDANVAVWPGPSGLLIFDVDTQEAEAVAEALGLLAEPTYTVHTGRDGFYGRHLYFAYRGPPIRNLTIAYTASRFELAAGSTPGLELKAHLGYAVAPPSIHPGTGRMYEVECDVDPVPLPPVCLDALAPWIDPHHRVAGNGNGGPSITSEDVPKGGRHRAMLRLIGNLLHRHPVAKAHGLAVAYNDKHMKPPLGDKELERIFLDLAEKEGQKPVAIAVIDEEENAAEPDLDETPASPPWPTLDPVAYYGLAGDFVRLVQNETEADPAGLLLQFLVAAGNAMGPSPHVRVGPTHHKLNLFLLLVGQTARARKGTAWDLVRAVFREADPDWSLNQIKSGLSSGEGLIWAVRDPIHKQEPIREKGRIVDYQDILTDQGIENKRLLALEPELAQVLRMMQRDGNILNATLRQAWDGGDLRILTKATPATATGAHISVVGHITQEELRRELTQVDMANGFANRFLIACVTRSGLLPEGGAVNPSALAELNRRLAHTLETGSVRGLLYRDDACRDMWRDVYASLAESRSGLAGAVTSRAEAQTLRLSALFAALDESSQIRIEHLTAALACWRYCEASAVYLFGDSTGDPIADRLMRVLKAAGPSGLPKDELYQAMGRQVPRARLTPSLELLRKQGLAVMSREQTGGRPRERWTFLFSRTGVVL
jgi:hypothetical protein